MDNDRYRPPEQREGQQYSPEEMMARLKKGEREKRRRSPREEGELVTREDGSQVIKVRRRKRRSKQRKQEKPKTSPKVKWAILGSVIGLCILLVAATVFIIAKYNGRSFKEETESNISALSGAEQVTITQMRVTPVSAKASKVEMAWGQHHFLKSATFHHSKAKILATSFLGSDWNGEEVVSSQAKVYLRSPATSGEETSDPAASPYKFGSYRCNQLDLHFGEGKASPAIVGMQASLSFLPDGRQLVGFSNGKMLVPGWPELVITSGVLTMNSTDVEIESLLETGSIHKGKINIKGRINKDTSRPVVLDVKAKDYPLQDLLGKGLGRIIQGDVTSDMGSLTYKYDVSPEKSLSFIMPFSSGEIRMMELPLFNDLKELTGDTQYLRPVFNDCSATLMRTNNGVTLNDIDFKSTSVITLKGKLSVSSRGKLSGSLFVSLPRRMFSAANIPPGFSGPRDGVYTAKVTLGGTIHNPYDNLNELLKPDSGATIPPPPSSKAAKEKEFEDLLR